MLCFYSFRGWPETSVKPDSKVNISTLFLNNMLLMLLHCGVGEDSWESLGLQEIIPINPKGNQSWIFIGRTDAEAETPILWLPDAKNWPWLKKILMLGKIEGRRRRGQQRMRWLDGITDSKDMFEQASGVGDGQGSLACCSPWGCKELDMTERLNWTENILTCLMYYCYPAFQTVLL